MAWCLGGSAAGLLTGGRTLVWVEVAAVAVAVVEVALLFDLLVDGAESVVMAKPPGVSLATGASVKLSTVALTSMTVTLVTVMGVYLEAEVGKQTALTKNGLFLFLGVRRLICNFFESPIRKSVRNTTTGHMLSHFTEEMLVPPT